MNEKYITRVTDAQAAKTKDKTNLKRLRKLSDADIKRAVADDPDTFIPDAKWWRRAKMAIPQTKDMITLRLDPDVLKWFRKHGRGYQTRINAVLRAFVEAQTERVR